VIIYFSSYPQTSIHREKPELHVTGNFERFNLNVSSVCLMITLGSLLGETPDTMTGSCNTE